MKPCDGGWRPNSRGRRTLDGREGSTQIARRRTRSDAAQTANIAGSADFFKHANRQIAKVGLQPAPTQLRRARTRVMVAMPVLALEEVHQREPMHVAAGILTQRCGRLGMTDAVDETLRVHRKD